MEGLRAGRLCAPPQPLAVPPSIRPPLHPPPSHPPGHPVPPHRTSPAPAAGRRRAVPTAISSFRMRCDESNTDWAGGLRVGALRWADSDPGWAGASYGQVCPGRAGAARLCHDIQVFPLPVLSLAVRTEPDQKYSN